MDTMRDTYQIPPWLIKVGGTILAVIIVLALVRPGISGGETPPPTPTQQPAYVCDKAENEIAATQDLIARGKFALAADMANETLRKQREREKPLCSGAKLALASLAYNATVSYILSTQTSDFGQADVPRWQEAERRAVAAGVPNNQRMSPMALFTQANNIAKYWLARAVFLKAWDDGIIDHQDLRAVIDYYTMMRNLGANLVERRGSESRLQALMILRTAHETSRCFGLQRGEAGDDLRKYVGSDPKTWPQALSDDPVFMACVS